MTTEQIREGLSTLFTTIEAPEGPRIVFADGATGRLPDSPLYEIVSNAQRESGHGFKFSYTIANKAVDAILEAVPEGKTFTTKLEEGEDIQDAVMAQVPIMNWELALIVQDVSSWDRVEESLQGASGTDDCSLANILSHAWDESIRDMAQVIMDGLASIEDNDATV